MRIYRCNICFSDAMNDVWWINEFLRCRFPTAWRWTDEARKTYAWLPESSSVEERSTDE